jgi:hypothetical protein
MMTSSNGIDSRFKSDLLFDLSRACLQCIDPRRESVSEIFLRGGYAFLRLGNVGSRPIFPQNLSYVPIE